MHHNHNNYYRQKVYSQARKKGLNIIKWLIERSIAI